MIWREPFKSMVICGRHVMVTYICALHDSSSKFSPRLPLSSPQRFKTNYIHIKFFLLWIHLPSSFLRRWDSSIILLVCMQSNCYQNYTFGATLIEVFFSVSAMIKQHESSKFDGVTSSSRKLDKFCRQIPNFKVHVCVQHDKKCRNWIFSHV